jgi:drug/metabolite transporter (DMT)-like permease
MYWLILTILAVTSRATYSIATKILSKYVEVSAITQSVLLTALAGLLVFPLSPFIGGISFVGVSDVLFIVAIMIASQAFGNILFFKGVKLLDAGTAQVAFSSVLVWGVLLSIIFLGSQFSLVQFLGILLMLIAIILVQSYKGKKKIDIGILYILSAAALFAVFQVTSAELSKTISTSAYLLLAYLGSSLLLGALYSTTLRKDWTHLKTQVKKTLDITLFASGTSLLYFLFAYFAYQQAPDQGIVVVLLTSQVVLSVILGIIFLKERENVPKKLIAGVLAFIAAVLIKS